jgi:hypothetical protein
VESEGMKLVAEAVEGKQVKDAGGLQLSVVM